MHYIVKNLYSRLYSYNKPLSYSQISEHKYRYRKYIILKDNEGNIFYFKELSNVLQDI